MDQEIWLYFWVRNTRLLISTFESNKKFHLRTNQAVIGPVLNVSDPELAKIILVKDFHIFNQRMGSAAPTKNPIISKNLAAVEYELWKRIRPVVSPTFTSGKMKKMYPLIDDCSKFLIDDLESHVINKKELMVKDVFGCLTMDVIAKCAFGTDTNANQDKYNPFVVNGAQLFDTKVYKVLMISFLPKFVLNLIGIYSLLNEKNNEFFLNVARHIIRKRRANNERRNDLLQHLMDCQSSDQIEDDKNDTELHYINQDEEGIKAEKQALNGIDKNQRLTEDEICAQAWIFFIAGYETTATTLSFCSYELALNQEIQNKLYQELKLAIENNGDIDYDTLSKLPYLDAVISETLRKYPPVQRLERTATQTYQVPNTKVTINKGNIVYIPVYAIHHDEEYYPSPETFKPERFLPENRHLIKPYTYLPFGCGPRNCVGMRFGLLEAKLALTKILLKYKFVKSAKTQVPLEFLPNRLLLASKSIIVGVERR